MCVPSPSSASTRRSGALEGTGPATRCTSPSESTSLRLTSTCRSSSDPSEDGRVGGDAGAEPADVGGADQQARAGVGIELDHAAGTGLEAVVDEAVDLAAPVAEAEDLVEAGAGAERGGLPG